MLKDIKLLYGLKLSATDCDIGHVKDFLFDDQSWHLRYLVADTGRWLVERQVLLSRQAFSVDALSDVQPNAVHLHVNLTREQIEAAPSIDTHRPVSRQFESAYFQYYGWPNYWDGGLLGAVGLPAFIQPPPPKGSLHHGHNQRDDLHLRSTRAITGYTLQATDGPLGTVSGFIVDGKNWTLRGLIIETGTWFSGKMIHLPVSDVARISYEESTVFVNLTTADVEHPAGQELSPA